MSIFAISDLHLSLGCDKPMDVFGSKWSNYTERMYRAWNSIVSDDDLVIVPGDISWAMYIDDAVADFEYIHSLKGRKLLLKGNHDYWWTTTSKMNKFLSEHSFDSIDVIRNNAYLYGNTAICGTRGWNFPSSDSDSDSKDKRIFEREKQRLVLSLEAAKATGAEEILVAMHYPPIDKPGLRPDFLNIMKEYGVNRCIYGHLHAAAHASAPVGDYLGINLKLVSCDYLNFIPLLIKKS